MPNREITHSLVDVMPYAVHAPDQAGEDAVYDFTHSHEVNEICSAMLPPHVLTPVAKSELEDALSAYIQRRGVDATDAARIREWLGALPDELAILERAP